MTVRSLDKIKVWHIAAICAIFYLLALTPGLSVTGDDAAYILKARSFVDKGFFREAIASDGPARSSVYYFMLPLALMPFVSSGPHGYILMKLIPLASAVGSVLLLGVLLDGIVEDRRKKAVLLLFGLNPWTVEYSGLILTDMPYIFLMLGSLVLYRAYRRRNSAIALISSAVIADASFYTRPAGAILCASLPLFAALKRRWKDCLLILAVIFIMSLPIAGKAGDIAGAFTENFVKKQHYYAYEGREASAKDLGYRAVRNLLVYAGNYLPDIFARSAVSSVEPRMPDGRVNPVFAAKFALGAALAILILAGFFITAGRMPGPYHIYVAMHIAANALGNVYVARYLLSILPFMALFLVVGSCGAAPSGRRSGFSVYGAAFITIMILISLAGSCGQVAHAREGRRGQGVESFVECNDWVRGNTAPDAVILSRKPSYTKLHASREAVGYIFTDDTAAWLEYMDNSGADFVITADVGIDASETRPLERIAGERPDRLRLIHRTDGPAPGRVYEVLR